MALPTKLADPKELGAERTYTPEEFEALPEFNENYELVDGRVVQKPMPGGEHGLIARKIYNKVFLFDPEDKLGRMWFDVNFNVGTGWMPIPDLGYLVTSRNVPITKKSLRAVPDLVIEIHSPSDLRSQPEREAVEKKIERWQAVGVRMVWSINPEEKTVKIYHPDQAAPVDELSGEQELSGEEVIPGFKLKVSELFD